MGTLSYKQQGTSDEVTELRSGANAQPCFSAQLTAANGFTTSRHNKNEPCDWQATPSGLYACGLAFCSQRDGAGRSATSFLPRARFWDAGRSAAKGFLQDDAIFV